MQLGRRMLPGLTAGIHDEASGTGDGRSAPVSVLRAGVAGGSLEPRRSGRAGARPGGQRARSRWSRGAVVEQGEQPGGVRLPATAAARRPRSASGPRAPPRPRLPPLGMHRRKMSADQPLVAHDASPAATAAAQPLSSATGRRPAAGRRHGFPWRALPEVPQSSSLARGVRPLLW